MGRVCRDLLALLIISGLSRGEPSWVFAPSVPSLAASGRPFLCPPERPWPDLARAVTLLEPRRKCEARGSSGASCVRSLLWALLSHRYPLLALGDGNKPGVPHSGVTVGCTVPGLMSPSATPSLQSAVSGACGSAPCPLFCFLKIVLHFEMRVSCNRSYL